MAVVGNTSGVGVTGERMEVDAKDGHVHLALIAGGVTVTATLNPEQARSLVTVICKKLGELPGFEPEFSPQERA